ncbi:Uncharacterized protein dnm_044940 [Desulfonema magnum]|uniref:Uncharacterized protein n=1 Tax=Desulfonema magnum TaxID=45655 RepID=A0A975BMW8_9BACT|nr:Uncharacterized protein dnm_044940 [Desulfonema magnum]
MACISLHSKGGGFFESIRFSLCSDYGGEAPSLPVLLSPFFMVFFRKIVIRLSGLKATDSVSEGKLYKQCYIFSKGESLLLKFYFSTSLFPSQPQRIMHSVFRFPMPLRPACFSDGLILNRQI